MAKRMNDGVELIKTLLARSRRVKAEAAEGGGAQRQPWGAATLGRS